jgi:ring-1,2-phenylacetyl-CoA epoxidase subunit PaaC
MTATLDIAAPQREALGRLIASLADNKAALGRRYGEWAVSAPTLESAVAAAAMAQDELGHARATYPLLKQLRVGGEQLAGGGNCMPVLAQEFPGWQWFVAVNLVVDGMLTALVRACEDSAFAGLAQRARKILQEEQSHTVHARAWARRLARDDQQRDAFAAALADCWRQATLWAGPELDSLTKGGYVSAGADALRSSVRETIAGVLSDTDLADVELPNPSGASPNCPNCGRAERVTLVSAFGGQIITAQWHCEGCRTHFEAVRDDFGTA